MVISHAKAFFGGGSIDLRMAAAACPRNVHMITRYFKSIQHLDEPPPRCPPGPPPLGDAFSAIGEGVYRATRLIETRTQEAPVTAPIVTR